MATRDLGRLAERVSTHRNVQYKSRLAAARAAGISKDTWKKVEDGAPDVLESTYVKICLALGWSANSWIVIAEGGEPVLAASPDLTGAAQTVKRPTAEEFRSQAYQAAMRNMPATPIGEVEAFVDDMVAVMRKVGGVSDAD